MDPVPFPRFADASNMVFVWTLEEVMPVVLGLIIGVINGSIVLPLLVGIGITTVFRRFRETKPDGYILHRMYWHGLMSVKGAAAINPFHREVIPA